MWGHNWVAQLKPVASAPEMVIADRQHWIALGRRRTDHSRPPPILEAPSRGIADRLHWITQKIEDGRDLHLQMQKLSTVLRRNLDHFL